MAGTAGRPPYTKVGQYMRWQDCDVGSSGGWWGFAVSVLSSAEDSGVSCSAHFVVRQVAKGVKNNRSSSVLGVRGLN